MTPRHPLSCLWYRLSSHPFQLLVTQNLSVEFLLHPVKEISAAFVLPAFDVDVETVAVFGFDAEYPVQERGKLFERHFTVVDTAHFIDAVDKFHEVDGVVLLVEVRIADSGGTWMWSAAACFCIFRMKERALRTNRFTLFSESSYSV